MSLLQKMPYIAEPKKKNRWLVRFPSSLGIQEWWLSSASRPTMEISPVEIPFLNTSTYVAGRFTWQAMDITFRDPIGPSAMQALMEWTRLHAESVTGRMGYAAGYKKNLEIEMLDPSGVVVEKWVLEGAMITNISGGDLSMDDDGLAEITINVQMDRAILLF